METNLNLSIKQREYIANSHHRWNFKHGATRSGKTFLDYWLIPLRIHERRGLDGLNVIIGNTRGTIQRNVLDPMRNIWGFEGIGSIKSDNTIQIFGEQCYCLGADKRSSIDRLRGSSIKYCYGDEVATWNEGAFEMLKSRLDKPYSMFEGTTNPRSPSHWLKQFIDSDADVFAQHYKIDDNPFLDDKVKEAIKSEYSGVFYDRYVLGLWTLAEGLIYPMYQEAIGVPPEGSIASDVCVSMDYGTQNPFAALVWEKHGGVWYAVDGYYYSGRDTNAQKTDTEYGEALDRLMDRYIKQRERLEKETFRPQNKIRLIVDPSAASFIALMRKKSWCKVIDADNSVSDGLRDTSTAMKNGLIKINPDLKEWIDEVEGYVWGDDDKPVKENDHYMDATRYFVETMNITAIKRQFTATGAGRFYNQR